MQFNQRDVAMVCAKVCLVQPRISSLDVEAWFEEQAACRLSFVTITKLLASEGGHESAALRFMLSEQSHHSAIHTEARKPKKRASLRIKRVLRAWVEIASTLRKREFGGEPRLHKVWTYHGQPKDRRPNVTLH